MELSVKLDMDAMDRVVVFGERPGLPLTPKATALFAAVSTKLTALRAWGTEQITGKQDFHDGVSNRQFLSKAIRETLNEMAGLAKSMEEEGETGMSDFFPRPRYLGYEPLLLTAESFADRATSIAAQFTDRGMPAAFIADLRANITAFRAATDRKHAGKANRRAGTAGMAATVKAGMKAVRALRPILRLLLKNDAALLAAWNRAARVERYPRRAKQEAASDPSASLINPQSAAAKSPPDEARKPVAALAKAWSDERSDLRKQVVDAPFFWNSSESSDASRPFALRFPKTRAGCGDFGNVITSISQPTSGLRRVWDSAPA